MCAIFISKALRLARINEESYSFTGHPHVNPHMEQGNRRLHFARAVHSRHPFPADPIFSERGSDGMIPCAA